MNLIKIVPFVGFLENKMDEQKNFIDNLSLKSKTDVIAWVF